MFNSYGPDNPWVTFTAQLRVLGFTFVHIEYDDERNESGSTECEIVSPYGPAVRVKRKRLANDVARALADIRAGFALHGINIRLLWADYLETRREALASSEVAPA